MITNEEKITYLNQIILSKFGFDYKKPKSHYITIDYLMSIYLICLKISIFSYIVLKKKIMKPIV